MLLILFMEKFPLFKPYILDLMNIASSQGEGLIFLKLPKLSLMKFTGGGERVYSESVSE